jgi:DNA-binding NtrC family response regulator
MICCIHRGMRTALVSWIGATDLRAPTDADAVGVGPIAQALDGRAFDEVYLATDYPAIRVEPYLAWLRNRSSAKITVLEEKLSGPTNFGEIYEAAIRTCEAALNRQSDSTELVFHLSPGTPAMAAVWVILAKTRFPAELIESSREHGVRTASVPFDISADFIPDLLREQDERLRRLSSGRPPVAPEFEDIVHRSRVMARLIERGRRVSVRNIPVLVEGESGTGKELIARAIHRASTRRESPFVALNCGAIPAELIESQLFGHERGAFTGATQERKGYFEAADKSSLFLDEIGELPTPAQVKLLRVLQEGEIVRVGSTRPVKVDVRIIAATNRTLTDEVTAGRFREDLYYRLAVAVLKVPPLRERAGDVGLLVDRMLDQVNQESSSEPGYKQKKLSAGARNLLLNYSWPGNVRELQNTLRRAAIWSDDHTVATEDIREAMMPPPSSSGEDVLNRLLGEELRLPDLLRDVARHYMTRALEEADGNKTRAAELVGLPSYQTFTNWMKKYGIRDGTKTA